MALLGALKALKKLLVRLPLKLMLASYRFMTHLLVLSLFGTLTRPWFF